MAGESTRRIVLSLILFGISFGFVEASVVVYLRYIAAPIRAQAGLPPSELFPLLPLDRLGPARRLANIERVREAATLVMLAAVAWAAAGNLRGWLAAFSVVFGVWDLAFYGGLWATIGWPASLNSWDVLFLIPVPWAAPVLAPVLVAASLAAGGIIALVNLPRRVPNATWALLLSGAGALLISFTWDWQHWLAGGLPRSFPWAIFAAGELLGIAGFLRACANMPFSLKRNRR